MAILIANIGTSDLAIKIDNYYIPVGFDREEKNLPLDDLTSNEKEVWEQGLRNDLITEYVCPELGVTVKNGKFSLRELTEKLLYEYQNNPEKWHSRLSPGRIWGVVNTAIKTFNVKTAYLFVTNQPPTETRGYYSDTIHLFEILKLWFDRELNSKLELKSQEITTSAIDQDQLFDYYYKFFNKCHPSETILISMKGGTPQMATALKMQAIASVIPKQLFIDPQLSVKNILSGEPSTCQLTTYWYYLQSQKYQAVKLLLEERWDFDGAITILKDWQKVIGWLQQNEVHDPGIVKTQNTLSNAIALLSVAVDCLNLDIPSAKKRLTNLDLGISKDLNEQLRSNHDPNILNLYTRCRIYWELKQVSNLLVTLSSFYEEVLSKLLKIFEGESFLHKDKYKGEGKWYLDIPKMRQEMGEEYWQKFYRLEAPHNSRLTSDQVKKDPLFQLTGRPSKSNFLEVLVSYYQDTHKQTHGQKLLASLKRLDYWAQKRNRMIHQNQGMSVNTMKDVYENDKEENPDACPADKICEVMADICNSDLGIVHKHNRQKFVGDKADYYLYTPIRKWVIDQLLK
ncbi:hypothetical protein BJP36_02805 [Moorena producens JHB]|uniref:Uncharacterized protein n=1 Tax=Moorena producens (strain JHB) TaxID=1454205 RepID=A0A1D9FV03_MOOP1|nr:hypothetical protein [Moorena producens]AOY78990.1 hypothetical protein BJP36_02805 [Moorena producens JHB]